MESKPNTQDIQVEQWGPNKFIGIRISDGYVLCSERTYDMALECAKARYDMFKQKGD